MSELNFEGLTKAMSAAQVSGARKKPQPATRPKQPKALSTVAEEDDHPAIPSKEPRDSDSSKTVASGELSASSGSTASYEGELEVDKMKRKAKKDKDLKKQWQRKVKARHADYLFTVLEDMVPKQIKAAEEQYEAWLEVQGIIAELKEKTCMKAD